MIGWSVFSVAVYTATMLVVAVRDFHERRISNRAILFLLVAYVGLAPMSGVALSTMATSTIGGVVVFALGLSAFSVGWIGGGDVKLLAVSTIWLGWALAGPLLLYSLVFGGLSALIALLVRRVRAEQHGSKNGREIAFGPAIAAASILLVQDAGWLMTESAGAGI